MASTGYGPSASRGRLYFDGDESKYELWEVKFLGYMHLQKLQATILPASEGGREEPEADKNSEAFAEIVQCLDDRSLALVFRDAQNDGRKALGILREHYLSAGKPRIIALYTELTSLKKSPDEALTDYMLRAETAAAMLKSAGERISDSLLVAMVLKGLPGEYKPFITVTTQKKDPELFVAFKSSLRSYEETMRCCGEETSDNIMTISKGRRKNIKCYGCGQFGHMKSECKNKGNGDPEKRERKRRWWNQKKEHLWCKNLDSGAKFQLF